jgi:hypothetical protein
VTRRRLVLAVLALSAGAGLATPAMAATSDANHKVCVMGPTPAAPNQEGLCVWWSDPLPQ